MNLKEYFDDIESNGQAELARIIGVSPVAVFHWRSGRSKVPIKHALTVEKFTGGKVTRKDMYPDTWKQIWPELEKSCSKKS